MNDQDYIQQTLQLAAQGTGLVSPNPLVGSLVVKDGVIVGRGYHRYDELKHAEVWALEEAGEQARGATLYVNLEPCSYQGAGKRTPPCAQALIEAGVRRVVVSMMDPNPRVSGQGFTQLRAAGLEVITGVEEQAALRLNEKFVKFITTGLPFVHWKAACSLDGRIATRTGDARWITGEAARQASQNLRHEYDAILVGVGTALADDPRLTDRTQKPRRQPLARVVLDSNLRLPLTAKLVQTAHEAPLLVFTAQQQVSPATWQAKRAALEQCGVEVIPVRATEGRLNLPDVLTELGKRQISSLIVEGGAEVASSFVAQRLLDKVTFFFAPKLIGGRDAVPVLAGEGSARLSEALELQTLEIAQHGPDWSVTGYPQTGRTN